MNLNDEMKSLHESLKSNSWYSEVGVDEYNNVVVYAKWMSLDVLSSVPLKSGDRNVLIHFLSSKVASKDKYTDDGSTKKAIVVEEEVKPDSSDISFLMDELDRLEKLCGLGVLESIFYEVHDGKNAVTNLSEKFPEIRKSMNSLYDTYGFDVIYEEI